MGKAFPDDVAVHMTPDLAKEPQPAASARRESESDALGTRLILIAAGWIVFLDQLTKWIVHRTLAPGEEKVLLPGFFKFVHWGNTGAAWSMFYGNNEVLAIISLAALLVLFLNRKHFDAGTWIGQLALGLIFGGIVGNLIDRLRIHHVTDFIYFFLQQRGGVEKGFPAFNIADTAICTGVGLLFLLSLKHDSPRREATGG